MEVIMFGWLKRMVLSLATSWPPSDSGIYIAQFREELNDVAKELAEYGYPYLSTCFRMKEKDCWVDFYNMKGVVAEVRVHGEMSRPDELIVACNLSIEAEALFAKFFPYLRITFKALTL